MGCAGTRPPRKKATARHRERRARSRKGPRTAAGRGPAHGPPRVARRTAGGGGRRGRLPAAASVRVCLDGALKPRAPKEDALPGTARDRRIYRIRTTEPTHVESVAVFASTGDGARASFGTPGRVTKRPPCELVQRQECSYRSTPVLWSGTRPIPGSSATRSSFDGRFCHELAHVRLSGSTRQPGDLVGRPSVEDELQAEWHLPWPPALGQEGSNLS